MISLAAICKLGCWRFLFGGVFIAAVMLTGCTAVPLAETTTPVVATDRTVDAAAELEASYGIRVDGLRLSAAGSMLDFRYRVTDPEKAAPILNGKIQPFLLDATHQAKLGVPDTPVLGRLRQTSRNNAISTNRTYFIMFGNPGKALQSGDKVTLLLNQTRVTELTVQ